MSEGDDTFKNPPNRKPVCDFIRILLMDILFNVSANTHTHPLLLLLEVKAQTRMKTINPYLRSCNCNTYMHCCQKSRSAVNQNPAKLSFLQKVPLSAQLLIKAKAMALLIKSFTTRSERAAAGLQNYSFLWGKGA